VQLVVFSLGRDRYALPVERVREVIRHRAPTAGVIDLRGSLVPVRDIAEPVGAAARAGAAPSRAEPKAQPSRKRSEKATRSTGGADTGSPSSVTE
jgi:hypothetical protein